MSVLRRRWIILLLGLPLYMALLAIVASIGAGLLAGDWVTGTDPTEPLRRILAGAFRDGEWWSIFGPFVLAITATQIVFLIPIISNRPPRGERSRPMLVSLVLAGAIAAVMTAALAFAIVEMINLLWSTALWESPIVNAALGLLVMGSWCFWSAVLMVFTREIWPDRLLGRIVGTLLAGTVIELIAIVPLDIMVRRRTDCYCFTGTFFALTIGAVATLWLTGPGIVIALTCKKHRLWRETHCSRCGYPMGPSPSAACPECGHAWIQGKRTRRPH